jgi:hypothetical protein
MLAPLASDTGPDLQSANNPGAGNDIRHSPRHASERACVPAWEQHPVQPSSFFKAPPECPNGIGLWVQFGAVGSVSQVKQDAYGDSLPPN